MARLLVLLKMPPAPDRLQLRLRFAEEDNVTEQNAMKDFGKIVNIFSIITLQVIKIL